MPSSSTGKIFDNLPKSPLLISLGGPQCIFHGI
jgi:hypothetical protein